MCTAAYPQLDGRPALPLLDRQIPHERAGDWLLLADAYGVPRRAAVRILGRPLARLAEAVVQVSGSHLTGVVRTRFRGVLDMRAAELTPEADIAT